jgi:phenylacetate-CoA ligase
VVMQAFRAAYQRAYEPVVLRAFDTAARRRVRATYRWLSATQWRSSDEIRHLQERQLRRLLSHAHRYSALHRARLDDSGWRPDHPRPFDLLAVLPSLDKADIQRDLDAASTVARWRGARFVASATSGSTGTPTVVYVDSRARDRRVAVALRNQQWIGVAPGEPTALLWGTLLGKGRRSVLLEHAKLIGRQQLLLSAYDLSNEALAAYTDRLERFRPRLLIGYASALHTMAAYLEAIDRTLEIPRVISTAEKMYEPWRAVVAKRFSADVFERYGSRELGDVSHSCATCGDMHVNDENVVVEVERDSGELLVTDLTNYATPLIRYRIGDRGSTDPPAVASCGRGLGTMRSIEGRAHDVLLLPGGGRVAAVVLPMAMKDFPSVRRFQAWQPAPDELQLLLETPDEPPERAIRKVLEPLLRGARLELIWVDTIPATPAAKTPVVVHGRSYVGPRREVASQHTAPV